MNKKSEYEYSTQNLCFWILAIFTTLTFMTQIYSALYTIKGGGVLNNIQYTILELKISVTRETYNHVYIIANYPLIPIMAGVIYNIYILVKSRRIKDRVDS